MKIYDVSLTCFNKQHCVRRDLRYFATKEEAKEFIADFLRIVIESCCKDFYHLNHIGTCGPNDYNYTIRLRKDVIVYLCIDNH